ncbi:MAG: LPXTG cell wall anchor domain-containing protein [Lactobacillus sp.]|nr:LPXTG cell wall anchor domain-containing protein [Lactobacillus sp.]
MLVHETGNDNSISLIALGALTAIFGLGIVKKKQF